MIAPTLHWRRMPVRSGLLFAGAVAVACLPVLPGASAAAAQTTGVRAAAGIVGVADPWELVGAGSYGFLDHQLRSPRVRRAFESRGAAVEATLDGRGVEDIGQLLIRVFKRERELEVWARERGDGSFTLVKTYPVCDVSGDLGPKRRQGDRQIPEGFYTLSAFNPESRYHLSMRVDYPNAVDRVRGHEPELGGDIYIHGGCATVGCVPVGDAYIEELYLMAAAARDGGQRRIPIHIFPTRLDDEGLDWLKRRFGPRHVDLPFWRNLRDGYRYFEDRRLVPSVTTTGDRYTFGEPIPVPAPRRVRQATLEPLGTPVGTGGGAAAGTAPSLLTSGG